MGRRHHCPQCQHAAPCRGALTCQTPGENEREKDKVSSCLLSVCCPLFLFTASPSALNYTKLNFLFPEIFSLSLSEPLSLKLILPHKISSSPSCLWLLFTLSWPFFCPSIHQPSSFLLLLITSPFFLVFCTLLIHIAPFSFLCPFCSLPIVTV